jgi:hypothetical protein
MFAMSETRRPFQLLTHEKFQLLSTDEKIAYLALAVQDLATHASRLLAPDADEAE